MDTDGNKRGLQSMVFKDKGGQGDLSKVIFGFGNDFCDELRAGDKDLKVETAEELRCVTKKQVSASETKALLFANKICKHTKSNAIVFATEDRLLSSGVGQTSRVDALRQAVEKAKSFGFDLKGSVMASDAFFPFPDCVELANLAGVKTVIQPGGSVKDQESIDYCDKNDMAMVFTGFRHFKH